MTMDELKSLTIDVQRLMDRIEPHAIQSDNDAADGGLLIFLHGMRLAQQGLLILAGCTDCDLDEAIAAAEVLQDDHGKFKIVVPRASQDRALRYLRMKLEDGLQPIGCTTKIERPQ